MPKAIKIVLGVLIGLAVWTVVATVGNLVIRGLVSGYAEAEPAMRFSLPMLLARLGLGAVSSVAAGFVCATAFRSVPTAVTFLAVVLVICFVPVHYSMWTRFPPWYHGAFLVSLAPLVLLGARLARPTVSEARRAA
jgi:hypothetical protein